MKYQPAKNYDVYCDESGNSGGNYLDLQQPFYVLAGWMVERNESYRAKNKVNSFKQKYYTEKSELKGVEILKSNSGQQKANLLLKDMGEYCVPFFIIAEKRYCLAAKMVEAYLDPVHNHSVPMIHTWLNAERKEIADLIYNISETSIELFGQGFSDLSVENFTLALDQLIEELNQNGYEELASTFSGAYPFMESIFQSEFSLIDSLPEKAMRSLNMPVFISFIQMIEKFTTNVGIKNVRLFHDNTKQFEIAYPKTFSLYASKKKEDIEFELQNGQIILSSLKTLNSIRFSDSKISPLIQAADILAGFINMYATKTISDKKISPELKKFENFLVGGLLSSDEFDGNGFCDLICSKYFLSKLFYNSGLIDEVPTKESLTINPQMSF